MLRVLATLAVFAIALCSSEASDASEASYTKIFSEPIKVDIADMNGSGALSDILDIVYLRTGSTSVPTAYRFSALYGDRLYSPDVNVGRGNYAPEDWDIASARALLFSLPSKYPNSVPAQTPKLASFPDDCVGEPSTNEVYRSKIRLFNVEIDFSCILASVSREQARKALQVLARESVHGAYLIVHGAQERYLSEFNSAAKHLISPVNAYEVLGGPAHSPGFLRHLIVNRPWFDPIFWTFFNDQAAALLRNEYTFFDKDERLEISDFCFLREIDLLCKGANGNDCRVDGATCASISRGMLR